jgi:hypothetical protein
LERPVYSRRLKLTERFEDQNWSDEELDLSAFAGQDVEIVFTSKAEGEVRHQNYPLAAPDAIVLWSEPQIIVRRSERLDLIENFDKFRILPATSHLDTANKSYAFVLPLGASTDRRQMVVAANGEARYDVLIPERSRLTFQLGTHPVTGSSLKCGESAGAEILVENAAVVKTIYRESLPACSSNIGRASQSVSLNEFSGTRGTLILRSIGLPGKESRCGIAFKELALESPISKTEGPASRAAR